MEDSERLLGAFRAFFHVPLGEIKRSDVVRVLDALIASGKPYAANRALAALKKLMSWALNRGMIEVNPIAGLQPPAKEHSRERILTDRELRALLLAADAEAYPFGELYKMLVLTGQRRGEVTGMRWSEIDFGGRVWTIPSARSKNAQAHDVPLSEFGAQHSAVRPTFCRIRLRLYDHRGDTDFGFWARQELAGRCYRCHRLAHA